MPRAIVLVMLLLLPTTARLGLMPASAYAIAGSGSPNGCEPVTMEACCPLCVLECPCVEEDPVPVPAEEPDPYTPAPTDHLRAVEALSFHPVLFELPEAPVRLSARAARLATLSRLSDIDPQSFLCVRTT